jgi:hypothetical protein
MNISSLKLRVPRSFVVSLAIFFCGEGGHTQQPPTKSNWVSDSGYAQVVAGDPTQWGTLDVRSPAANLAYCTHKLCIDKQSGPVRYYPVMWTDKEWKVKYFADPIRMKKSKYKNVEGGKTTYLGVTLSVKYVPNPGADPECTGSLIEAKELKAFPLGESCFVYKKVR